MGAGRRKRIALLTNALLSSYQVALRDALERRARHHDCDFIVVLGRELEHDDLDERAQTALFDWVSPAAADGVIVLSGVLMNFAGVAGVSRLLARLAPLPAVSIGVELPLVPSITVDNRPGMRKAVDHLIEKHRARNLAFISGPSDNQEANERLAGYRESLIAHGLSPSDALVSHGRFTLPTGQACMLELLDRGQAIDAVVAANDYMALGAMDTLRARGISVPRHVRVVGFDDSPLARVSSCPLTSVAQPADAMAERAFTMLLDAIDGKRADHLATFSPRVVLRHSCGCEGSDALWSSPPPPPRTSASEFVQTSQGSLIASLSEFGAGATAWWEPRAGELVQALAHELEGEAGAFGKMVEAIVEGASDAGVSLENVRRSVASLERSLVNAGVRKAPELDRVWLSSLQLISEANLRAEGRASVDLWERLIDLRYAGQRVSVALDSKSLAAELSWSLPRLGVRDACVALLNENERERLEPILLLRRATAGPAAEAAYPASELIPKTLIAAERASFVVMLLTFEADVFGLLAVDGDANPLICEMLRTHIGAALKLARLHRRVIQETAARERADQLQLEGEIAIARQIQTALSPSRCDVPNLDISAAMLPAKAVGGDYYDVIPVPGGAWMCMGDVTGHGLLSGLIMLMIQSMITTLVRLHPDMSPSKLLSAVNRGLTPNIRERLRKEEHATIVAIRFFDDGTVKFAGSHEELIVYRVASGKTEQIGTDGIWIGILPDISAHTPDQELRLGRGDILVAYTDGFVEARNAHGELFGHARLCALIESHAADGPEAIRAEMFKAASAWSPLVQDDLACLIARYEPGRYAAT